MSTNVRARLLRYLSSTGWTAPDADGPAGRLWRHPDSRLSLPVPVELTKGTLDWEQVLLRLSEVEGAEPTELADRFEGPIVDIANLRAANDIVISDTIPYDAGLSLLRESWTMLRSCATTSMGAKADIARYRKSADYLLEAARMAHTRKGSFIIPIHLPLPDDEQSEEEYELPNMEVRPPESSERRIMRTFAESLATVHDVAIIPEKEPNADAVMEIVRAGVSHQFTSALHRILANDSVAEFGASFEWGMAPGPAPQTPSTVNIPAMAAERVQRIGAKLKTQGTQRRIEVLTGPIIGVHRDDDDQAGVVTIQAMRNARKCHVSVNVSRERLDDALDWMKARSTVVVQGQVRRTSVGLTADKKDGLELLMHTQLPEDRDARPDG